MAFDLKKNILNQFLAMAPKMVGIKYSSDIVILAFGYYATSRTLYNRLREFSITLISNIRKDDVKKFQNLMKNLFVIYI